MKKMRWIVWLFMACTTLQAQEIYWQAEYQALYNGENSPFYSGGFDYAKPAWVDIDADGDLDLFVGYVEENGVCFIRNDGNAAHPIWILVSNNYFDLFGSFTAPTFCDIDGDGDLDAFIGDWNGKMVFFRNTGTANSPEWSKETDAFAAIDVDYHATPTFCDIDADQDFDLIIGNTKGKVYLFRNTGTAQSPAFAAVGDSLAQGVPGSYAVPQLYDIDADGDADLFIGTRTSVYFFQNQGSASQPDFQLNASIYGGIETDTYNALTLGDVDGDGDADILIGNSDFALTFYENTGTAASANWQLITDTYLTLDVRYPCFPAVTDIDGDGDWDILLGSYFSGMQLCKNDGSRRVPNWSFDGTYLLTNGNIPAFCDIDNDGDPDLFAGQMDGTIDFIENTGTAAAAAWAVPVEDYASLKVGNNYCSPAFCDIDADGDFDLFLGTGEGTLVFIQNTGDARSAGWAAPVTDFAFASTLNWKRLMPRLCDIDRDGDSDLFVGGYSGQVAFYRNNGTASAANFSLVTPAYNETILAHQTCPLFCDIDDDGDTDMFWGMDNGGMLFWRNIKTTNVLPEPSGTLPQLFDLYPNHPNPFNPRTTLSYRLPKQTDVVLTIANLRGQIVRTLVNSAQPAGFFSLTWDATDEQGKAVASGVYTVHLRTADFSQSKRLTLAR